MTADMSGEPSEVLRLVRDGESFFSDVLDSLTDESLRRPSRLEGWTRAHVTAHVARNAQAITNLCHWARTGIETPMYTDAAQRARDIELSSTQAATALREDVATTSQLLVKDLDELPMQAWSAAVRTSRGRLILASDVPWLRARETWIHALDLDGGASARDLPDAFATLLVDDVITALRADCGGPAIRLVDEEGGRAWDMGGAGSTVVLRGRVADLACWLVGRADVAGARITASDGDVPTPPKWL